GEGVGGERVGGGGEREEGDGGAERDGGRGHRRGLVEGVGRIALEQQDPEGLRSAPAGGHRGRARAASRPSTSAVPETPPGCLRPSRVPWKSLPAVTRRASAGARA